MFMLLFRKDFNRLEGVQINVKPKWRDLPDSYNLQ